MEGSAGHQGVVTTTHARPVTTQLPVTSFFRTRTGGPRPVRHALHHLVQVGPDQRDPTEHVDDGEQLVRGEGTAHDEHHGDGRPRTRHHTTRRPPRRTRVIGRVRSRRAHDPTVSTRDPCLTNQSSSGMPIQSGSGGCAQVSFWSAPGRSDRGMYIGSGRWEQR